MTKGILMLFLAVVVLGGGALAGVFLLTGPQHRLDSVDRQAVGLLARGEIGKATAIWEDLHEQRPQNIDYINRLGIAYTQAKDYARAEAFFRQAMKIDEEEPQAYFNLALLRLQQEQMEQAEEMLLKLLTIADWYPEANYHLGYICQKTGRLGEAQEYYVREINVNGSSAKAWRGYLALKEDEYQAENRGEFGDSESSSGVD